MNALGRPIFFIGFVHIRLVFQISSSLKVSTVHEPCLVAPVVVSISNVCDDIMELLLRVVTSPK